MNFWRNNFKIEQSDRNKFCANIIEISSPRSDFYFLVIFSSLIVTFGFITNNIILLIGGILITPMLSPLLAIALGMVILNVKVIFRSLKIFFIASILSFLVAYLLGFFVSTDLKNIDIIHILDQGYLVFLIAFIAGIVASFMWAKPSADLNMSGIAITTTVLPPLIISGISCSVGDWELFNLAMQNFLWNILGIIIASLLMFFILRFYKSRKVLIKEVVKEEKIIKKENGL